MNDFEIDYDKFDLISNDLGTLKEHYVILLNYVKLLEQRNRELIKENRILNKKIKSIKNIEVLLGMEDFL